jgi:predicted GH43/DUF377 family glycosyl hydrolase
MNNQFSDQTSNLIQSDSTIDGGRRRNTNPNSAEPKLKLHKWSGNPILQPKPGSWWEGAQTRNPAAVLHEGKVHLFYTAAGDIDVEHKLCLGHAVSSDGFNFERVGDEPFIAPSASEFDGFDAGGVEDPRAVSIDGTIYITYCARSVPHWSFIMGQRLANPPTQGGTWTENMRRGGLIATKDLVTYERLGPVTSDDHYDCNIILFPEKVNGRYAMLHRPSYFKAEIESGIREETAGMSICFSEDLKTWGDDQPLIKDEYSWENGKVGGSGPPIKTKHGWLTFYHGVQKRPKDSDWHIDHHFCYRAGIMLLDLDNPAKVIARCPYPVIEPEAPFEKFGTVNNVVFPTGNVVLGDDLFLYYGGADTVCCVATIPVQELLEYVMRFPQ